MLVVLLRTYSMKQEGNIYKADKGKLIVRIADDFIMGDAIDLGSADSIDNYKEREFTDEEIKEFFKSIDININNEIETENINDESI